MSPGDTPADTRPDTRLDTRPDTRPDTRLDTRPDTRPDTPAVTVQRPRDLAADPHADSAARVGGVREAAGRGDDSGDLGRRLRVVHVIATLTAGGAERQLEMLTAHTRHETQVISCYESGGIAAGMRAAGEQVLELQADGWRKILAPLRLARLLRRARPDVVHVHLLTAQVLAIPAARLARAPMLISTEHSLMDDTIEGRPQTWWLRLLYRALERMTTHTIAVSEVTAQRLQRLGVAAERISVADLGIDFDRLGYSAEARHQVRQELGLDARTRVIGAVGRLDPVKRIDVVLAACAPLLDEDTVLVVAGAGPLDARLRAEAERLGIADRVHWLGSRAAIGPVLSAMDILVSASADETFGMAIVEAVGNGLPVVHVTCPALEELAEPVPQADHVPTTHDDVQDADRLREAVAGRLSRDGQRRWPVPGSLTAAYGATAAAGRVDAVYDQLLAQASDRQTARRTARRRESGVEAGGAVGEVSSRHDG